MRRVMLFNLVLLAVAVGAAATWAAAGAGTTGTAAKLLDGRDARDGGDAVDGLPAGDHALAGRVSRRRSTSRTSMPRKRTATRSSRR